ncbi:hypothetical protein O3G_MSEX005498 [Manduca sexta]|uniref:CRAL-TRIO domain-containing protein n=1 Tax=Manduca sexta TaxID=7130 RepID=A0A921YZX4_MANSE|nr:hypothetical protein O3G_MSEX005498 [Manduca sexta]
MLIDLWQFEEGTWPGFIIIFDLAGMKLGHLSKIDLHVMQQFLFYLQEAMLVKFKGMHFLNAPPFMDKLMMLIRQFMKKELLEVVRIHQIGSDSLDAYFPIQGLPKDAGGQYKSYAECKEEVILKMRANKHYFEEENKKRLSESLRPGKPKTITDIFGGIEGSFKKLEID